MLEVERHDEGALHGEVEFRLLLLGVVLVTAPDLGHHDEGGVFRRLFYVALEAKLSTRLIPSRPEYTLPAQEILPTILRLREKDAVLSEVVLLPYRRFLRALVRSLLLLDYYIADHALVFEF